MTTIREQFKKWPVISGLSMFHRIRPMNLKHPVILPIGHEVVMKMKKDRMLVRVPDGDKKMLEYEVVGMEPAAPPTENASTKPASP